MTWTGTLRKDNARLQHTGTGDTLDLAVTPGQDGALVLTGQHGEAHWTGTVDAARKALSIACPYGFRLSFACAWVAASGAYALSACKMFVPEPLRLPDEDAEISA